MKSALVLFLTTLFLVKSGVAQWNHINSTSQYTLSFVKVDETSGVCIAGGTEFIKSFDNGATWINNGTAAFLNIYNVKGAAIITNSTYVLAHNPTGTTCAISRTNNGGASWNQISGLSGQYNDLAYNGNVLIAVGNNGVVRKSIDGGISWSTMSSGTTANLMTVEWDANQNKWIIGGVQKMLTASNSDPLLWNVSSVGYTISNLNFRNNNLVETRIYSNYRSIVQYDINGTLVDEVTSSSILLQKSFYVSPNRIISHTSGNFYKIEFPNNSLFQYVDTLINSSLTSGEQINDLDFGSTYGIAVGPAGALAKYDMYEVPDLKIPSNFILSATQSCPNSPFTAIPEYAGGSSFQWFIDNLPVSTNDTLFYNQPISYGYHSIKLVTVYNGNSTEYISNIYTIPPPSFPTITVLVDTTLCYLQQVVFNFQNNLSITDCSAQILQNGAIVTGPVPLNFSSNLPSVNMSVSDTLSLQLVKTGTCGTFYQTTNYYFHVGPNLSVFNLVSADSGICSMTNSHLDMSISNLIAGASYTFNHGRYTNPSETTILSSIAIGSTIGAGSDTINMSFEGSLFYALEPWFYDITANYEYVEIPDKVLMDVTYQGCSMSNIPVFNFDLVNTKAFFAFLHQSTQVNDTIEIVSFRGCDSVSWSINPSVSTNQQLNDSVPLFISDTPGEYEITLIHESRFGCIDTTKRTHIVASPLPNDSLTVCHTKKLPTMKILGSKIGPSGNYYEYGYYNSMDWYNGTNFCLRKLDQAGNLLWEKRPSQWYSYNNYTIVITAIDIDQEDNVYASIFVYGPLDYELIHNTFTDNGIRNYLVKWDAAGQMTQATNLGNPCYMDLVVQNDKIHLATSHSIVTTDLNFNLVHISPISGNYFGVNEPNNSLADNWNWDIKSPQLKKMQNGNIAVVGHFSRHPNIYWDLTLDTIALHETFIGGDFIYAAQYNPIDGFIKAKKIFESKNGLLLKDISIDEENNIYILTQPLAYTNFYTDSLATVKYFDSTFTNSTYYNLNKSFITKIDSELNPVWLKETSLINGSINYSLKNEKIILSGGVYSDFYIGSNDSFSAINAKNKSVFTGNPTISQPLLMRYEPIFAILNRNGIPESATSLGRLGIGSQNPATYTSNAISPCGDILLSHQDQRPNNVYQTYTSNDWGNQLEYQNTIYNADSNLVFKLTNMNCVDECSYIHIAQTITPTSCSSDTNFHIPIYASNNIDSVAFTTQLNGQTVEEGFFYIEADHIVAHVPQANTTYNILLFNPTNLSLIDTISTEVVTPQMPLDTNYFTAECNQNFLLTVDEELFQSIYWSQNGSIFNNGNSNTFFVYQSNPTSTVNQYTISAFDTNGCHVNQSFDINFDCEPHFAIGVQSTYCSTNNEFQIPVEITNTQTPITSVDYVLLQGGNIVGSGTYQIIGGFIEASLPQTNTVYEIVLYTANGQVIDTIVTQVSAPLELLELDYYYLTCARALELSIDSQSFDNVIWNFNGAVTNQTNVYTIDFSDPLFNQLQSDNIYYFNITALDSNGCNSVDTYQIEFCTDTILSNKENSSLVLQLYPNPATSSLNITLNEPFNQLATVIYDLNGRSIKTEEFNDIEAIKLDISELSTGYYILHIGIDNQTTFSIIPFTKE